MESRSVVVLRARHMNSHMATRNESPKPPSNTTKTPPTLANDSSVTWPPFFDSSEHWPPPRFCFHQRSFNVCNMPDSCNWSMACDRGVRYGESEQKNRGRTEQKGRKSILIIQSFQECVSVRGVAKLKLIK